MSVIFSALKFLDEEVNINEMKETKPIEKPLITDDPIGVINNYYEPINLNRPVTLDKLEDLERGLENISNMTLDDLNDIPEQLPHEIKDSINYCYGNS